MRLKFRLYLFLLLLPITLLAQPEISYITPDIGARGMSLYIEMIGPHDKDGNFGSDGVYVNGTDIYNGSTDNITIETVDPDDSNKVTFGPVMISWNGKMVSTYIYINPQINLPNTSDWETLADEFIIEIRVNLNGSTSNSEKFYILRPFSFDANTLANNTEFGTLPLGKRSPRGAMLFDKLELANQNYTVSTQDCDPNTPGNQGFLPVTFIVEDYITGIGNTTIDVSGLDGTSYNRAGDGGPGGGGGGGRFCDLDVVSQSGERGDNGGDGFTGGGRGGWNDNRSDGIPFSVGDGFKDWGEGTSLGPNGEIGFSLNGVSRAFDSGYEAAGGGTGHPFGLSGVGVFNGNTGDPDKFGGYGGGTGASQDKPGGGGGFGTNGSHVDNRFGRIHGNAFGVPLAGGSGGAGGNPQASFGACAGNGGGGGGAIAIYVPEIDGITIISNGGNGENGYENSEGGGGSGGLVGIYSKLPISIQGITVNGGVSGNDELAKGGLGYARLDFPSGTISNLPPSNITSNGITTDTSRFVRKSFNLTGSNNTNFEPFDIFIRSRSTNWQLIKTVNSQTPNWVEQIDLPGNEDLYYLAMIQKIPDTQRNLEQYVYDPPAIMSHAATNILVIERVPKIVSDSVLIIDSLNCKGSTFTFFFPIWNEGDGDLDIRFDRANFADGTKGFELISPTNSQRIAPGDTVWVEVRYTYNGTDIDLFDVLQLRNNDPSRQPNYQIEFIINNAVETNLVLISGDPNFGDLRINESEVRSYVFENQGTSAAYIENLNVNITGGAYSLINTAPILPSLILPGQSITFDIQFQPTSSGNFIADFEFFSTQSDSSCEFFGNLILEGNGITSRIIFSNYEYDYGIVPYCIQIIDTLTIYNPGTSNVPIKILEEPRIESANSDFLNYFNFRAITQNITYEHAILPGDSIQFEIIFTPEQVKGQVDVRIKVRSDVVGDEITYIPITAFIEVFDVIATPDLIDFGDVWVGFDYSETIELLNNGSLEKILSTDTFTENQGNTKFEALGLLSIMPNSSIDLGVNLNLEKSSCINGSYEEKLMIYFGLPCEDSLEVTVRANCLFSEVSAPDTLDFGILSPCESGIPQDVIFENNSEAPYLFISEAFEGDADLFIEEFSDFSPITLFPNDFRSVKTYTVTPNSGRTGIHYSRYIVSILSNGEIISDTVVLKVNIVPGQVSFSPNPLIFANTKIGNFSEQVLTINNIGPWNISIQDIYVVDQNVAEFEIINNFAGTIILPGDEIQVIIRFSPLSEGSFSNILKIDYQMPDCDYSAEVALSGIGDPAQKLFIKIPNLQNVDPDLDNFEIPIYARLENQNGQIFDFTIDELELLFNRSIFFPVSIENGNILENEIDGNNRRIKFNLSNITIINDTVFRPISKIIGYTMLGDNKYNDILWNENAIDWVDSDQVFEIEAESGSIDLTICREGDDRLLSFGNNPASIIADPNPANNFVNIKINMLEAGNNEISIISVTGKKEILKELNHSIESNAEVNFSVNLEGYASGMYFIQLQSQTIKQIIPIFIIK